jgi:hypothetical protein
MIMLGPIWLQSRAPPAWRPAARRIRARRNPFEQDTSGELPAVRYRTDGNLPLFSTTSGRTASSEPPVAAPVLRLELDVNQKLNPAKWHLGTNLVE